MMLSSGLEIFFIDFDGKIYFSLLTRYLTNDINCIPAFPIEIQSVVKTGEVPANFIESCIICTKSF